MGSELERKYLSFKKGVEDALRKFTTDIGDNVKGMREEINLVKEELKKKRPIKCKECKDKFIGKSEIDQIEARIALLEDLIQLNKRDNDNDKDGKIEDHAKDIEALQELVMDNKR